MIPFEIEKMRVEHVWLKSCTTALGGSISVVDDTRTTKTKEVYKKIEVPLAVVRAFAKQHEISRDLKPVLTAVTFYDDHAVALERHPLGNMGEEITEGLFGKKHWVSDSETNLDRYVMPLTLNGDWYTDGTFIYTIPPNAKAKAEHLSSDGRFRSIQVSALKMANINDSSKLSPDQRTCLQYVSPNGHEAMTSPIWKTLGKIGSKQIERAEGDDDDMEAVEDAPDHQFDRVDQYLSVNLGFALKAGKEVSELFGYDSIEPLRLDDLMVQLRTVNLPKINKSVKQTFDIGLPFTHAVAWLIGMTNRTNTLESYVVLRSLLKYLTTKGVYRKGAFDPTAVYKQGMSADNVVTKTMEEAAQPVDMSLSDVLEMTRITHGRGRNDDEVGAIGTLYGAE